MTCREFQSRWNELLDAETRVAATPVGTAHASPAVDDGEQALLAHAASCPACCRLAAQWRTLRQTIRVWRQPPVPPAGLADRILAQHAMPQTLQWTEVVADERRQWRRINLTMACAWAASFLALALLPRFSRMIHEAAQDRAAKAPVLASQDPGLHSVAVPGRGPAGHQVLHRALAEATSATWDLARSASEPAARISRDVLDVTTRSDADRDESTAGGPRVAENRAEPWPGDLTESIPLLDRLAPDSSAASAVLQQVGDQLSAGVRPLSDTARHAFGFLTVPGRPQPGSRRSPPSEKGA